METRFKIDIRFDEKNNPQRAEIEMSGPTTKIMAAIAAALSQSDELFHLVSGAVELRKIKSNHSDKLTKLYELLNNK